MIGLDACDRGLLKRYAQHLPHISAILDQGAGGDLRVEPMSGGVWATFVTGTKPGEHGIVHQLQWDPLTMQMRCPGAEWLPIRPFWRDLAEQGAQVVAFDIPFVFPGPAQNVLEVSNWGAHDRVGPFWANDKAVERRIRAKFGAHSMGVDFPVEKSERRLKRELRDVLAGAALKAQLCLDLMRQRAWDVFLVAFGEIHRGGHGWPADAAAGDSDLLRIYKAVDEAVGAIVAEAGPDTDLVIFSLHGMGKNTSQSHMISAFVQRALAHFRDRPFPAQPPGLARWLRQATPASLQLLIAEATPQGLRDALVGREIAGGYKWSDTYAFDLHGDPSGYVRLNIRGREAHGAVDAEGADVLKAFLRDEFLATTLADGRPAVSKVSFPSDEAQGARRHLLPDILLEWNSGAGPACEFHAPRLGIIHAQPRTGRCGNHRFEGFYAHRGPRQGQGFRPQHISELGNFVGTTWRLS